MLKQVVFLVCLQLICGYYHSDLEDARFQDDVSDLGNVEREYYERPPMDYEEFEDDRINKRSDVKPLTIFESKALLAHNNARNRHVDTPSLTYSKTLEMHALAYALKLTRTNTFDHDTEELKEFKEGENLYKSRGDVIVNICDAVFAWYNEIIDFDYKLLKTIYNVFPISVKLGHFTQIVWKATTEVGCAGAYRPSLNPRQGKYDMYIVCRYKPAGNVIFQFPKNIMPLKPGVSGYLRSYSDVCGKPCIDKDICRNQTPFDCNRAFFGPVVRQNCPKLCKQC